ncbi:MAG: hypothetical protein EP312_06030 [Gammaproteobacteria bacterium]|nr:MAG: hypothetical protein EP312_06030 [Gammaproteobacteria bacterium]
MPARYWLAVLSMLTFFHSSAALGCSCGYPSAEEYLQSTDLAFEGEVISIKSYELPIEGFQWWPYKIFRKPFPSVMVARFKVNTVYKGENSREVDIRYVTSSSACGWKFEIGEKGMVIARGNQIEGYSTSMCAMIPFISAQKKNQTHFHEAFEQYRTQRQLLQEQAEQSPENIDAWIKLADFFATYHDDKDAENAYMQALTIKPDHAIALIKIADLFFREGRYQKSLENYTSAWQVGHSPDANKGKTLSLVKLGQTSEAIQPGADISGIELDEHEKHVSFRGLDMTGVILGKASLYSKDFSNSNLTSTDFTSATLNSISLKNSKLENANFSNAYFHNIDFSDLDFSSAKLKGARFSSICYNKKTLWPNGFDVSSIGNPICPNKYSLTGKTTLLDLAIFTSVIVSFIVLITYRRRNT